MTSTGVLNAKKTTEIPSLNGIRAVAVLIVFIGHGATIPGIWPGHFGVTVFFFLSGYLITTLLVREHRKNGRIALGKFYARRAFRILPPAYLAIALSVLVGVAGLLPSTTTIWGVLAEVFNVTNYYMVIFGREGLPPESTMLWSLAVEEHFYLVLPAVLILFWRRGLTQRTTGVVFLVACALAPVWRIALYLLHDGDFLRLYVASDTRFDGLLAGAALALLANPAERATMPWGIRDMTLRRWLMPAAIVVAAVGALAPTPIKLTVADTAIYIALAVIFWYVIRFPTSLLGRILNNRLIAHVGVLSFSIYLLHRLVIALVAEVIGVDPLIDIVSLILTLGLAQLVYLGIELPAARMRKRLSV